MNRELGRTDFGFNWLLFTLVLGWGGVLRAQNTGTILGTVKDQTGAVQGDAGRIETTRVNARQMQFALRLVF